MAVIMAFFGALSVLARDFQYNGLHYTIIDEEAHTCQTRAGSYSAESGVTAGNDYKGTIIDTLTIPATAKDGDTEYAVVGIGEYGFYGSVTLTALVLPSGVTHIGQGAFQETPLTSVTLPSTLAVIGDNAFRNCALLGSIILPASLSEIGEGAFGGQTSGLTNVTYYAAKPITVSEGVFEPKTYQNATLQMPNAAMVDVQAATPWNKFAHITTKDGADGVYVGMEFESEGIWYSVYDVERHVCQTRPGTAAKRGNEIEGAVTIPSAVTLGGVRYPVVAVGEYGFADGLATITLPEGVVQIGANAFAQVHTLESMDLPDGVSTVFEGAFRDCDNLKKVTMTESVRTIGEEAFRGCAKLSDLTLSPDLTTLGKGAFHGCSDLPGIAIPSYLERLPEYAFADCISLASLTLHEYISSIGEHAFAGCAGLAEITYDAETPVEASENVFDETVYATALLSMPNATKASVTSTVPWSMFREIVAKDGKVPVDTYVGKEFEHDGIWYTVVSVEDMTCETRAGSGDIFSEYESGHFGWIRIREAKPGNRVSGNLIIPSQVNDGANDYTVIGIGDFSFADDARSYSFPIQGFSNVTLPPTISYIGKAAFGESNLKAINFPNGLKSIGYMAFGMCTYLVNAVLPEGLDLLSALAFQGCTSLNYASVPSTITSLNGCVFEYCESLSSVRLPDTLEEIGYNAFNRCERLAHIDLPESLTTLNEGVFRDCTSLKSIRIPSGVKEIPQYGFSGCRNLEDVSLPEGLTTISLLAFYGCKTMENIDLPPSLLTIEMSAFEDCSSLTAIVFPESLSLIGRQAFASCSGLVSVTFPEVLPAIAEDAFSGYFLAQGCDNIRDVYYPASIPMPTYSSLFGAAVYENATLHMTNALMADIQAVTPWKLFKHIKAKDAGREFEADGIWYTVLDGKAQTCETRAGSSSDLEGIAAGNEAGETLIIPETVNDGEADYRVVRIGDYGFYGNDELQTLTLPGTLETIGASAFAGCLAIETIQYSATTPLAADENVFSEGVYASATLYLPESEVTNSKLSTPWGKFEKIVNPRSGLYMAGAFNDWAECEASYEFSTTATPGVYTLMLTAIYGDFLIVPGDGESPVWSEKLGSSGGFVMTGTPYEYEVGEDVPNLYLDEWVKDAVVTVDMATGKLEVSGDIVPNEYDYICLVGEIGGSEFVNSSPYLLTLTEDAENVWQGVIQLPQPTGGEANVIRLKAGWRTYGTGSDDSADIVFDEVYVAYQPGTGGFSIPGGEYAFKFELAPNAATGLLTVSNLLPWHDGKEFEYEGMWYVIEDAEARTCRTREGEKGGAFTDKEAAPEVRIPAQVVDSDREFDVVAIGAESFDGCTAMTSVEIPSSIIAIGEDAFRGCTDIATVYYDATEPRAFDEGIFPDEVYAEAVLNVPDMTLESVMATSPWNRFIHVSASNGRLPYEAYAGKRFECGGRWYSILSVEEATCETAAGEGEGWKDSLRGELTLPSEVRDLLTDYRVTGIGASSFNGCTALTSVTIPAYIASIGGSAFAGCVALETVTYEAATPLTASADVFDAETYGSALLKTPEVPLDDVMATIPWNLFHHIEAKDYGYPPSWDDGKEFEYDGMWYVIEDAEARTCRTREGEKGGAFTDKEAATEVRIPAQVVDREREFDVVAIGAESFDGCTAMTSVEIPSSIIAIGEDAFRGCTDIATVYYDATEPRAFDEGIFPDEVYAEAVLNVPDMTLESVMATSPWNRFIHVSASNGRLPYEAYAGKRFECGGRWYSILSVEEATCETAAGEGEGWKDSLRGELTLPSEVRDLLTDYRVTGIGASSFNGCTALTSVTIPAYIASIGGSAFAGCVALETVTYEAATPLTASADVFDAETYRNATLEMPEATLIAIQSATPWGSFEHLRAKDAVLPASAGTIFEDNGLKYSVISGVGVRTCRTVAGSYRKPGNDCVGELVIPSVAHIGLSEFAVTEIGEYGFSGDSDLTTITIPASVTNIGIGAFTDCERLSAIMYQGTSLVPADVMSEGDNPNRLLYVNAEANAPSGLSNVVVMNGAASGECQTLILEPGYPFMPMGEFTAAKVEFAKAFRQQTPVGGNAGWETIVLPFEVGTITYEGRDMKPLGSSGSTPQNPFWLYEADKEGLWRESNRIRAGVPYIIAMPNSPDYDPEYNVEGEVTFSATGARISRATTAPYALTWSNSREFRSLWMPLDDAEAANAMGLNSGIAGLTDDSGQELEPGSAFCADVRPRPFEGYVTRLNGGERSVRVSGGGQSGLLPTTAREGLSVVGSSRGLTILSMRDCTVEVFRADGVCVARVRLRAGEEQCVEGLPKGVYIVAGMKVAN